MPVFRLTYFDIEGAAEKVRLAFKIGGIPFIDDRISFAQWPAKKAETPLGQLPILTVDDSAPLTQSGAMLRYVGQLGNLIPSSPDDLYHCEELIGICDDIANLIGPSFYITMRPENYGHENLSPEELKKLSLKLREKLLAGPLQKVLSVLDDRLGNSRSGFAVGDHPSIADCAVLPLLRRLRSGVMDGIPTDLLDGYDNIRRFEQTIMGHPPVNAHYGAPAARDLELMYFDGPGRARIVRLILTAGKVPFKDTRYTFERWPAVKTDPDSLPNKLFSQLPCLQTDGFLLAQSGACALFAAEIGLYKTGVLGAAHIDAAHHRALDAMILAAHNDFQTACYKCLFGSDESKAAGKEALPAAADKILMGIEMTLQREHAAHNYPYTYGTELSVSDLAIYDLATSPFPNAVDLGVNFDQYPHLSKVIKLIKDSGRFDKIF